MVPCINFFYVDACNLYVFVISKIFHYQVPVICTVVQNSGTEFIKSSGNCNQPQCGGLLVYAPPPFYYSYSFAVCGNNSVYGFMWHLSFVVVLSRVASLPEKVLAGGCFKKPCRWSVLTLVPESLTAADGDSHVCLRSLQCF